MGGTNFFCCRSRVLASQILSSCHHSEGATEPSVTDGWDVAVKLALPATFTFCYIYSSLSTEWRKGIPTFPQPETDENQPLCLELLGRTIALVGG